MIFLRLLPALLAILVIIAFITQIVIPLSKGTKLLPWFRKERTILENQITTLRTQIEEAQLASERDALLEKLNALIHPSRDSSTNK